MDNNGYIVELLVKSWEFCSNENIPKDLESPLLRLTQEELKKTLEKKRFNSKIQ